MTTGDKHNSVDPMRFEPECPALAAARPSRAFIEAVPFDLARAYHVCGIEESGSPDWIVATEKTPLHVIADVAAKMPGPSRICRASEEDVAALILRAYAGKV